MQAGTFNLTPTQRLACALARRGVPGARRVMVRAGVFDDARWNEAPRMPVRLRWCGTTVELDLAEHWERSAWFLGRYHELPLLLLMNSVLKPGDTFVDIGANLGLVSLHAARLVGTRGSVHAYEPNPDVFARLKHHVDSSPFRNITLHPYALGARDDTLTLSVIGKNTGSGTIGTPLPHLADRVSRTHTIAIRTAAADAPSWPGSNRRVFLKIDVEGAERAILTSLVDFNKELKPLIVTEINPAALRMNGTNAAQTRHAIEHAGYQGWTFDLRTIAPRRFRPARFPLHEPSWPHLRDELWMHPDSPFRVHVDRAAPAMPGTAVEHKPVQAATRH
ncbi:MAG: FkbM family methyltransferase [Phycisphaeraceae bacterium]|nr:FkbM family methyltransferase [Phycisphaeraceae bacterium]MBX3368014.1 FkbM family methyltransferase [Phycisphaeraceae bacterium]